MSSDHQQILRDTDELLRAVQACSPTISRADVRSAVTKWADTNVPDLSTLWPESESGGQAVRRIDKMESAWRLKKGPLLRDLRQVRAALKSHLRSKTGVLPAFAHGVISNEAMALLKKRDMKVFTLASELNSIWDLGKGPNSCGILMRIILERALDAKDPTIKSKPGLKAKLSYSQSCSLFGKSMREALAKLDSSTKITGDIVAHDSRILLSTHDVELGIVPLNMLLKDVFS